MNWPNVRLGWKAHNPFPDVESHRISNRLRLNSFSRDVTDAAVPNSQQVLLGRRAGGALTWEGPAILLFARAVLAVAAQGLVAAIYAFQGSATPWLSAARWLPVYGTLIDAGCLWLLWWFVRREGIALLDLVGFDRKRLGRDVLLGLALILPSLLLIFAGNYGSSLLVYGSADPPQIFEPLPLWAALYGVLLFPLVWGITEQTTYNGYVLPRLQALSGRTVPTVIVVALVWSFQHAVMPLTFEPDFILYRMISPIAHSLFVVLVYLRIRTIVPLATAHWLMNGGAAFAFSLLPLLRG